jgi:hypothetical protein
MPALIIQTNEDGSVSIAAPASIPDELMSDAEQVASLEEASQVVQDVLGTAGEQPAAGSEEAGPGEGAAEPQGAEQGEAQDNGGMPSAAMDAQAEAAMQQGFQNVRGAPRR